ncbi:MULTISPECIES: signal peptidase I [Halobacteriovorax]|uniref:Signal peptidase I n=1 Tax=Halobacteriovorax vibrionivorans TaxID=2152716 RepID=A0ABY0INW9_9BACT|nr:MULTISPECIES: signal peptidase I [Halobacteriovorax]RZF23169.1 signal peptidase I [Halobacteriovorax vibrionivorans]TGD45923.1 signal peptidase I [Halobacteriovorax sp. Y22]
MSELIEEKILNRKKTFIKMTRDSFIIIISLLIFRSVLFEPYRIPSGSMIPTLEIGDFILVKKFQYGLKVPFSDIALGNINLTPTYLFRTNEVERGDIIVFKYPNDLKINYIKRVIGLPGETIEIKNKEVLINGQKMSEKLIATKNNDNYEYFQTTVNDKEFVVKKDMDNIYKLNFKKTKIPEGHYFVMGDNRDNSSDSRAWGFVPFENIRGRAFFVWFSMKQDSYSGQMTINFDRIFKSIN